MLSRHDFFSITINYSCQFAKTRVHIYNNFIDVFTSSKGMGVNSDIAAL